MTRSQEEQFTQDRLGNVNRELDAIRALTGMEDGSGLETIAAGDTGTDVILMEIPEDASGFHLNELHAYNESTSDSTFQIFSATLDDTGAVDTTTARSVRLNVGAEVGRTISYSGKEFGEDAVVVVSQFAGDIAIGGYMDRPEELEPSTEQTSTPG